MLFNILMDKLSGDRSKVDQELTKHYQAVFETDSGRIVLQHLATIAKIDVTTYNDNRTIQDMNEGKRQMFLHILHRLSLDPTKFLVSSLKGEQYAARSDQPASNIRKPADDPYYGVIQLDPSGKPYFTAG